MPVPYAHSQPDPQLGYKGQPANPSAPDGGNGSGQSAPYSLLADAEASMWGAVTRTEHFFGSVYDAGANAAHDLKDKAIRVEDVAKAVWRAASVYAEPTIKRRIGMDIDELKKAFIPGLLYSLAIVALTTFVGAGVGALLGGILSGGTLAIPAAVGGGELGFDAGLLILDALGIGFLLKDIFTSIPKVFELVKQGVETAWNAGASKQRSAEEDIDRAAQQLADAEAELVNIVLQGVFIWILSKSAVAKSGKLAGATKSLGSPATLAARGSEVMQALKNSPTAMRASLAEGAAELAAVLRRASKLTDGLADFVQKHFEAIVKSVTEDAEKKLPKPKGDSATSEGPSADRPASKGRSTSFGKVPGTIKTSSGIDINPTPGKTTTILGNYKADMKGIINDDLGYPKTEDFGPKPSGYNVLNVPDDLYKTPDQFWEEYNKPFLDDAIARGDSINLATEPTTSVLENADTGQLTGFGREVQYLQQQGYVYDSATSRMVKP